MVPLASLIVGVAGISVLCFGFRLGWVTALLNKCNVMLVISLTWLAQFFSDLPMSHFNIKTDSEISKSGADLDQSVDLRLHVAGVRGESATLVTAGGVGEKHQHWLFDSGGDATYRWQLLPLLRTEGVNRITGVLLSHGDRGHIGAMPAVISQFNPEIVIESPLENRSRGYRELNALIESQNLQRIADFAGAAFPTQQD